MPTGLCPAGDVRVSSLKEHSCGASTIQMRRVPFRTRTSTTSNNSAVLIRRLCCHKDVFVRWRCGCARHAHKQKPFHRSDRERLHLALSSARRLDLQFGDCVSAWRTSWRLACHADCFTVAHQEYLMWSSSCNERIHVVDVFPQVVRGVCIRRRRTRALCKL